MTQDYVLGFVRFDAEKSDGYVLFFPVDKETLLAVIPHSSVVCSLVVMTHIYSAAISATLLTLNPDIDKEATNTFLFLLLTARGTLVAVAASLTNNIVEASLKQRTNIKFQDLSQY